MSEPIQAALIMSIYRIITILVGCLIVYLGYRLFNVGIFQKAGELKAAWGERNLTLKQASPGTFFVLFGASIIAISIWRGVNISQTNSSVDSANRTVPGEVKQLQSATAAQGDIENPVKEQTKNNAGQPPAKAIKPASGADSTLQISGLGGKRVANAEISVQLRHVLSDQVGCILRAADEPARQKCRDDLLTKLRTIPTLEDLKTIERLEREYSRTRNPKTREALLSMKLNFVK